MNAPLAAKAFQARSISLASRYGGRTVVAIGAHPDDLELAIGGMLARLSQESARVVMAVVSIPTDYATRRAEAERAADILGCELRILNDGGPQRIDDIKNYQLVGMLDALVRELEPAAVLTHSANEFHRDHVNVHNACLSTQRLKPFDFFHFNPTMCRPVPVQFHPRAYVDVSNTIDTKMEAIAAHVSQFGARGLEAEMYRDLARLTGRMVGVKYAEGIDVGRMLLA
ncbi:MAG TPA: PIG-L deacetylase family protein [Burkholderiaceae bacterium]|nr:PIG-L deacetylase family protein [Burkholderiaceae bacterium]